MKLIAAVDKRWNIGYKGDLLVRIPADMKNFREITKNSVVVMGRKTLESFPGGQPLIGRVNLVLTRDENYRPKGAVIAHSKEEALKILESYPDKEAFIIGGEQIYRMFLPLCDTAYITYIDYEYEADTAFPNLDEQPDWKLLEESEEQTYFNLEYYFRKYIRA